jgi:hypothetical protein
MNRISARLSGLLAAGALCTGVLAANCSKNTDHSDVGTMKLALTLPSGATVNSVHWEIDSSTGAVLRSGTINTSDKNATPSVDTSCPAGTGDRVTLTATTSDGTSCTGTSAPFNVVAGASVGVNVTLLCGGGVPTQNNGSVIVNGTIIEGDNCPLLTSWVASPLQTSVGGAIDVAATAVDADVRDMLTYSWSAPTGTFANPMAATTQFICGAGGPVTLTVVVSDNHSPTPCTTSMTFPVTCVPGVCGNGIVEPGEQCDPPNGTTCDNNCQNITGAGGSGAGGSGTGGVAGAGAGGVAGAGTGGVAGAGAGGVAGAGTGGVAGAGTGGVAGAGAGGVAGSGTGGVAGSGAGGMNANSCSPTTSCIACEMDPNNSAACPVSLSTVPGAPLCTNAAGAPTSPWGCDGFTGTARTNCNALANCIRTSNCAAGDDPTPCYCGNLTPANCVTMGAPATAACFAQYNAAATGFAGTVFTQFFDPSFPVGIANNLAACDIDAPCTCP